MFSITTIASSTTMPVASTIPNSVSVLIEKPNSLTKAKVPMSETGIVIAGMSVLRQFWRNRNITRITSTIASQQREQHLLDRLAHDAHVVEGEPPLEAGREALLEPRHLLHHALVDGERVGRGQQLDAHAGGLEAR